MSENQTPETDAITTLYQDMADGKLGRRDFMKRATALGVAGAAATAFGGLGVAPADAAQATAAASKALPLDVAEWSFMWVNVKRADTARGSFVGGQQMYVEYMIPTRVRHPFPIVLVHGGGGQGLDWMGTPDGRPGWFQHLVSEGYKVYVVDRPGHGRSPQHPDLLGAIPARPGTMENLQTIFIYPAANNPSKYRKGHKNWPGQGVPGAPDVAQFIASQGGSYVVLPQAAGAAAGAPGAPQQNPPTAANLAPPAPNAQAIAHAAWRDAGADLLDKIGPAIIMTHSAGGPFGLLVAEARPNLVKAAIMVEGAGSGFGGGNRWGMSTIPVTYDPPVADPATIKVKWVANPEADVNGYFLQEEPARKLPNLRNVAMLFVTAANSGAAPGNPGGPAFMKQAGVRIAEEYRLADKGITGNSHMMMVETNNRQVLQPILDFIEKNVNTLPAPPAVRKRGTESTAMRLAETNFFWVGAEVQKKDYGTVVAGQTFVQYFIPEVVRQPVPIILVHGGGGQATHYMGLDGNASWAHYYIQNGYKVYLIDRPGHGRSPVSVEALGGPLGALPMYTQLTVDTTRSAKGTPKRWGGTTGDTGDPLLDQIMPGQNAAPTNNELMQAYWRRGGAELLEKIGPAIIQTHSAGGPFGWVVANERPNLVKALVSFEGGGAPLVGQNGAPGTTLKLTGIPMMYLTAENSGRTGGPAIVAALNASGAKAEHINLKDKGITGNGHFAMMESNRKQVWDVIRGWIDSKVPALTQQTARG